MSLDRNLILKQWIVLFVFAKMQMKEVNDLMSWFSFPFLSMKYSNSFIKKAGGIISCAEGYRLFLLLRFLISLTEIIVINAVRLH